MSQDRPGGTDASHNERVPASQVARRSDSRGPPPFLQGVCGTVLHSTHRAKRESLAGIHHTKCVCQ